MFRLFLGNVTLILCLVILQFQPQNSYANVPTSNTLGLLPSDDDSGPVLHVGGALRYNFFVRDFSDGFNENDLIFTLDTWRINARVDWSGNIGLNFEYRFYPTFNTHFIKQGWLEYQPNDNHQFQLGVAQVPFGNLQYNSHNWWFQLPYYLGLEDDHDMGLKYTYTRGPITFHAAWFLMPESAGPAYGSASFGVGGSGRYSYDIIPITGNQPWDYVLGAGETPQSNQERNQFNLQGVYRLDHTDLGHSDIGFSVQAHSIYNQVLGQTRWSPALAIHLDGNYGNFNVKAQYSYYHYDATDDAGDVTDYVYMAAYGDPYAVASKGDILTLGIAYSYDVDWGPITNLQFYENISYMTKRIDSFNDTIQNVLGVLMSAGNVYTYFDIASGLNHPWLTATFGEGLGQGATDPRLNTRFNINIGYYF
jgi:hypothetical protein